MIGPADGLQFDLTLETGPTMDLAWGLGLVRLQGKAVWSGEDAAGRETALRWTWLDLLEFLARNWPWLVLEESYPIPVSPLFSGSLRREAEHRWERADLPEETIDREDEAVYLDRERALPVAEVLGGRAPEYAEKRARAFAAEFLLPRNAAAAAIRSAATLPAAIEQVQQRFQVGRELTAWQMTNSGAFGGLSPEEQTLLSEIRLAGSAEYRH